MFSHSQKFTVAGETFSNVIKNYAAAPSLPSDFRMIPMGDLDLRHHIRVNELRMDEWGVVDAQSDGRACVRRMHSAKAIIAGRKSRVTAAIYQGNDAEEEWRQDIAKHMSLRHPNIVQICGAASSNGIHATLFNDDLIPLGEFLSRYEDFHFTTVYIYAHCNHDFLEARSYVYSAFQRLFDPMDCTKWIRHSTGRLCAELIPANDSLWLDWQSPESPVVSGKYSLSTDAETLRAFIDSLTLKQYYNICAWNLRQYRHLDLAASQTMPLGAVFLCLGNLLEDSVEIAFLPSTETPLLGDWMTFEGSTGEVMPDGWTRFQSGDIFNNTLYLCSTIDPDRHTRHTWLSQANHIFRRLHIRSNFEDYVVIYGIYFDLDISQTIGDPPGGFLFLSLPEDFRNGPSTFWWPACPAYWSLDPSGVDRLSPEEVTRLGFPPFELITTADGYSWDASVYEGLCQLHETKGFDPYSQDVARYFGHLLYQLSSECDAP
ncbi:hypothetical protein MSAN_02133400 [Mycena sanguinolenta]|uniref:Protein kinase domain-containing protein n=1 Tax=Mycena sanguinolenta TaxID=230812 RepID=A0A8H7CLR3_9AGAR|nr:hypothetical protein MSAN_02133400 [Mycena sanguinolenta]